MAGINIGVGGYCRINHCFVNAFDKCFSLNLFLKESRPTCVEKEVDLRLSIKQELLLCSYK